MAGLREFRRTWGPIASYLEQPPIEDVRFLDRLRDRAERYHYCCCGESTPVEFDPESVYNVGGLTPNDSTVAAFLDLDKNTAVARCIETSLGSESAPQPCSESVERADKQVAAAFVSRRVAVPEAVQRSGAFAFGCRDTIVISSLQPIDRDRAVQGFHVMEHGGLRTVSLGVVEPDRDAGQRLNGLPRAPLRSEPLDRTLIYRRGELRSATFQEISRAKIKPKTAFLLEPNEWSIGEFCDDRPASECEETLGLQPPTTATGDIDDDDYVVFANPQLAKARPTPISLQPTPASGGAPSSATLASGVIGVSTSTGPQTYYGPPFTSEMINSGCYRRDTPNDCKTCVDAWQVFLTGAVGGAGFYCLTGGLAGAAATLGVSVFVAGIICGAAMGLGWIAISLVCNSLRNQCEIPYQDYISG